MMIENGAETIPDSLIGGNVDSDGNAAFRRWSRSLAVESKDVFKTSGEPAHDGSADRAVRAGNEDDSFFWCHGSFRRDWPRAECAFGCADRCNRLVRLATSARALRSVKRMDHISVPANALLGLTMPVSDPWRQARKLLSSNHDFEERKMVKGLTT